MREGLKGCVAAVAGVILLLGLAFAQAEVKVFVGGAMTGPVKAAGDAFSRSSGHTLVYVSDTTGALQKRLAAGEKADLVVVTSLAMDALQKENRVVAGTRVDLARALIGVAVRAGAASPDLSTPDTFKAALLKARSVSYVNPASGGTSGTYFEGLMQRMGIADAMKSKIVYRTQGSEVADAVAKGEAELGIYLHQRIAAEHGREGGRTPARRNPVADHLLGGDHHVGRERRGGARLPAFARRCRGAHGTEEGRARSARPGPLKHPARRPWTPRTSISGDRRVTRSSIWRERIPFRIAPKARVRCWSVCRARRGASSIWGAVTAVCSRSSSWPGRKRRPWPSTSR